MDTENETRPVAQQPKGSSFWREFFVYAAVAAAIVIPIRMWVAQPFIVRGSSMDTTFLDSEYLVVDELTYKFNEPQRGDVVIFRYPLDTSKFFIKRLIGLPGDTVTVKSDSVTIANKEHPEGVRLQEPYIHSRTFGNLATTLGPDEYFVMGDNRMVSSDSRVWGVLPKSDIIGRPIVRLLPLGRMGYLPGEVASSTILKR
ncbi:MAG TPA: signal peptidase I [Candidatus Paceibacterota bacterium]|nr:signal peptidase I [Candidatus Paceibacterota bacterium]